MASKDFDPTQPADKEVLEQAMKELDWQACRSALEEGDLGHVIVIQRNPVATNTEAGDVVKEILTKHGLHEGRDYRIELNITQRRPRTSSLSSPRLSPRPR
mmetsp:Transcript_62763/g.148633  ORF Transcript_62763/g.148633 Transcript_62763/m.148633 type:complete len:101 (+) Transcript_62763:73-375(+)